MTESKNTQNYIVKLVGSMRAKPDVYVGRVTLPKEWIGKTIKITEVDPFNE